MLTAPPPPKKEKKLRFDFSEGCSQKNYPAFKGKGLFFFPHLQTWLQNLSLHKRKKNPILLARAH